MAATIKTTRPTRSNTATWVDDRYGRLLAQQAVTALTPTEPNAAEKILRLEDIRRSQLYICERRQKVGWGVKTGTRVWHIDTSEAISGIGIYTADYDRNGRMLRRSIWSPPIYVITKHALARLFERMRTNSLDEVTRFALAPIAKLDPAPREGLAAEIVVVGRGTFHAVSELTCTSTGETRPTWILKTFIDKE